MGYMSEFSVKLSGMRRGSDDENQISRELQNLEEELVLLVVVYMVVMDFLMY